MPAAICRSIGLPVLLATLSLTATADDTRRPSRRDADAPAVEAAATIADQASPETPQSFKVFHLRDIDAATAAKTLGNIIPAISASAEPRTNSLLVSGGEAQMQFVEAVVRALEQGASDQSGRQILTEIYLVELALPAGQSPPLDLNRLIDPTAADASVKSCRSYGLRALENQDARLQFGGTKSIVDAEVSDPRFGGRSPRSIRTQNVGTIISIVGRAAGNDQIVLEFSFESSDLAAPPPADSVTPQEVETLSISSSASLRAGEVALLGSSESSTGADRTRLLIIGRARFAD